MTGTPTPGPWVIHDNDDYIDIFGPNDGHWIFRIGLPTDEDRANVRLIAAAPDTAAERDRVLDLNAELVDALTKLSNEASAWREEDLAEIGGWTNARCLTQRAQEARAVLAKTYKKNQERAGEGEDAA